MATRFIVSDQRHIWVKRFVQSKIPYYLFDKCDDISQDIMIKLIRADQREKGVITNYGYIKKAAMSVMIDHIRRFKSKTSLEDPMNEVEPSESERLNVREEPDSWAENQILLEQVYQAINGFSKQKQTTLLLYLRGLKIKDIATLTGCRISKVRNDVYRGKNEVIKQLNAQGISYEV